MLSPNFCGDICTGPYHDQVTLYYLQMLGGREYFTSDHGQQKICHGLSDEEHGFKHEKKMLRTVQRHLTIQILKLN